MSVTRRQLELFTDRHDVIGTFCRSLNTEPERPQILCLQGDGGDGKSLLIRYLRKNFCKRLQRTSWEGAQGLSDEDLASLILQDTEGLVVPSGLLDFSDQGSQGEDPRFAFTGLRVLRRSLTSEYVHFPIFDFGWIWYLHSTGRLAKADLNQFVPPYAVDFVLTLASLVSGQPWPKLGKPVFDHYKGKLDQWWTLYEQNSGVTPEVLQEITEMEPDGELLQALPKLFATDLNRARIIGAATNQFHKFVLFLDSHECFWNPHGHTSEFEYFRRDEWLRCMVNALELKNGIVIVLATRECPRWHEASVHHVAEEKLNILRLQDLSEDDGRKFLKAAGIDNPELAGKILACCKVEAGTTNPLMLGLCADAACGAAKQNRIDDFETFVAKGELALTQIGVIQSFLKYADPARAHAIKALAACRSFDKNLFLVLGRSLNFDVADPAFQQVIEFACTWEIKSAGTYTVHSLLRRLLMEKTEDVTMKAHAFLCEHYAQLTDVEARIESIFHALVLRSADSIERWLTQFEEVLEMDDFASCESLLEMDLSVAGEFDNYRIGRLRAKYLGKLGRNNESRDEYHKVISGLEKMVNE